MAVSRLSPVSSLMADLFNMLDETFLLMQSVITHQIQSCPPLLHSDTVTAASKLWNMNPETSGSAAGKPQIELHFVFLQYLNSMQGAVYQQMLEALSGYLRTALHFHACQPSTRSHPLPHFLRTSWTAFTGILALI